MTILETILSIVAAMGIPTAITGFCFWSLQRKISKRDKAREERETEQEKKAEDREKNRERLEVILVQMSAAAIALGEATARAVQRIPDAHCNGDMHKALDYAARVKHDEKDFLTSLGIHALHDDT